ncbi:MAG: ion transporter [Candidatus Woesearchaeota archaeon]
MRKRGKIERLERFVDRMIPLMIIILAVLIIAGFVTDIEHYQPWVGIADWVIIGFFVADLLLKWRHVRKFRTFVKLYWIDILAVFPFFLIFRAYLFVNEFIKAGEEAQKILHESILLRETKLLREAQFIKEAELSLREARPFIRLLRLAQRGIRLIALRLHAAHLGLLKAHKKQRS